ncbi:AI-2E family transporter [Pedobacter antarcticus]|uniref:Transporter n=2 Tax=Pedobacter antarcticus TaxID=34086 RepID=A0A081PFD5_9SPHI|nr:AI-2E family transporter [Pedobacter antarcticus]KEQ29408.1 transporter [Pedobacter antarcticus 4BY]SDM67508.1 Predicted PurR-regulated permease PerM [Pedobacter antarcticus]SFF40073.1 Predicted PurR-regulated permease PerM [Pedobacter antarcticus]
MEKLQRSVYILLILFLFFAGIYFAADFLIPLALAAVFSMLFIRLSKWLENHGFSKGMSALCCVVLFLAAIALVFTLLSWQLSGLTENLDSMKHRVTDMFASLRQWLNKQVGISLSKQSELVKQQGEQSGGAGSMLAGFASGVMNMAVNTILVVVYMFLFLLYRNHIKKFILKLIAPENREEASKVVHQTGKVAQHYLSGLAAMIGLLWIMYGIGFSLAGVESAIFFAVLCGILEIIPFIGNLTGTSITVLAVIAQGGDSKMIITVLVTYALVQFIQTYILEPLVVGEQVNINPLFTIMVIVLGELVWGIPGMVLAIPLLGMVKIICDHVPALQPYGFLIGTDNQSSSKSGFTDKIKQIFKKA